MRSLGRNLLVLLTVVLVGGLCMAMAAAGFQRQAGGRAGARANTAIHTTHTLLHPALLPAVTVSNQIITTPRDGALFSYSFAFNDTNPSPTFSPVSINWGDASVSLGTITGAAPNFTLTGSHTWANEGVYVVSVTITDTSTVPTPTATNTTTYTVSEGDVTPSAPALALVEGTTFGGTVLTFTDGSTSEAIDSGASFTATVDWGDGTMEAATVSGPVGGPYSVSVPASFHIYTDERDRTIAVTVKNETGVPQSPLFVASYTTTVGEGDSLSNPTFLITTTKEGATISGNVATFTDTGYTGNVASDFNATIDWGDNTKTTGTVTDLAGAITVSTAVGHIYADEGKYPVSVKLSDDSPGTATSTASGNVTITEADNLAVSGTQPVLTAKEGKALTGVLANFTDTAYTGNVASDFKATIDWGDGSTSSGVVNDTAGAISVSAPVGGHIYADEFTAKTINVLISDDTSGTSTANVNVGPFAINEGDTLSGSLASFSPVVNVPFSGVVANFTDSGFPGNVVGDFKAMIDWGDGTTTPGTVSGGSGSFAVSGIHTYTTVGPQASPMKVTLMDDAPGTAVGVATGTVIVNGCTVKATLATLSGLFFATSIPGVASPTAFAQYQGPDGLINIGNLVETACANPNTASATAAANGKVQGTSGAYTAGDNVTLTFWVNGPAGGQEVKIVDNTHAHTSWVKSPYVGVPSLTITTP